jgi:pentatricopeptide repeat protein
MKDAKKLKNEPKTSGLLSFLQREEDRKIREEEIKYKNRLQELKLLTTSVAAYVRASEEKKLQEEKLQSIKLPSDLNPDKLYKNIQSDESKKKGTLSLESARINKHSLIIPSIDIPQSISDRLGLALKYLISKDNQNWPMAIAQLKQGGGFQGILQVDARDFIFNIPPKSLCTIIPEVESLLRDAGLLISNKIINCFMKALSTGPVVTNGTIQVLEQYCKQIRQNSGNEALPRESYEIMIHAYGKNNNMEQINNYLTEMKKFEMDPSPNVFSNILTTCVYKAKDHKQAVEIFDTMKFLSKSTKPGTRAYQDIIVSYVNNDDIEKALDLYQEMIVEKVEFNQNIMVALARGCICREDLRLKAWDFMFEIYKNKWTPTLGTYEYMLYLSSKDGDLALTRALYAKLVQTNETTARAFGFLMLVYSKASANNEDFKSPTIVHNEQGRNFRRNILKDSAITSEAGCLPFLPISDLSSKQEILAESSAFWAYTLVNNPDFITPHTTTTYLNVASEIGTLGDFIDRYESSTYLDTTGMPKNRQGIIIETPEEILEDFGIDISDAGKEVQLSKGQKKYDETSIVKSPILKNIQNLEKRGKVPRCSLTYVVALKAAAKFKNYKFAQKVWAERGDYRKTDNFKRLSREEKDRLDFQFANAMLQCLTKMNLLEDALAILLSTEYQFKWTWKELTHLNQAAVEIGASKISRTIRSIASRAQLNFAGKVKRKDFKKYVMERGY